MNRREFIRDAVLIGGVTLGYGLGTRLLELSKYRQENLSNLLNRQGAIEVEVLKKNVESMKATLEAFELQGYRVQATAEAYLQDEKSLEEIMGEMPAVLIHNSFKINMEYQKAVFRIDPQNFLSISSGIIASNDPKEKRMIFLTAGHVLDLSSARAIRNLKISQPHLNRKEVVYSPDEFRVHCHPEADLALIIVDASQQPLPPDVFKRVLKRMERIRIDERWAPQVGEQLYSLSYPTMADSGIGFTPSIFKIVKKESQDGFTAIADSVIGSGASGAAVSKSDGTVVGMYVAFGPLGSYIFPIRESYRELLANLDLA